MSPWPGWEDYKPALRERVKANTVAAAPKRSKYSATRTEVDGITFDSKREAARYQMLVQRMKAGDVRRLRCQPRYALCPLILEHGDVRDLNTGNPSTRRFPVSEYVADFEYEESDRGYGGIKWALVIEDVKGARTDIYKLKKHWFEAQYGVAIREI